MSEKLLPCPFCGGEPKIYTWDFRHRKGPHKGELFQKHKIGCSACGVFQSSIKMLSQATADWNRRVKVVEIDQFNRVGFDTVKEDSDVQRKENNNE